MKDVTSENIQQVKEMIIQDIAFQIPPAELSFDSIVRKVTDVEISQEEKVSVVEKIKEERNRRIRGYISSSRGRSK